MGDKVTDLQKSEMILGCLNEDSVNFLRFIPPFSCEAFTFDLFDPHSLGFVSPDGTSVLLITWRRPSGLWPLVFFISLQGIYQMQ